VGASRTTGNPFGTATRAGGARRVRRHCRAAAVAAATTLLALTACTSAPETATPAAPPSAAASTPAASGGSASASPSVAADALTVDVTIADGDVTPNGEKLDVRVGQQVVLNVTSDEDDEIHAHTGGDGYALEVRAGVPATGTFTLDSAGSFEVESHHLEKVVVILNAR
jgi:hypothetical protein